jgi:Protein of unknown function (DUF1570)
MIQRIRFLETNQRPAWSNHVSRRTWLASAFLGVTCLSAASPPAWSMQPNGNDDSEADEIASVQANAKKAGLEPFTHGRTDHFVGLGDADDRFRNKALEICESLVPDFLRHFREKGFDVALPKKRLTVITLKSAESYQAFTGEGNRSLPVGGHYDLDTNRLVMFDFRPKGQAPGVVVNPERVNLLSLVHETTHLLCYNTGLLSRRADVPDWVSEGLATYVELWRKNKTKIGEPNRPWLFCLNAARNTDTPWIPITELVATDKTFDDEKTAQLSYAESWLMVHYLMKTPQQLPKFRAYLAGLQTDEAAPNRVEYAEKHLGHLKNFDHELARHLKRVSR